MNTTNNLFYPHTNIPDFDGLENVCISWFVYKREKPIAPYNQLIQDFDEITDEAEATQQRMAIDEYLTLDQTNELKDYLDTHPEFSATSFAQDQIYIPFRRKQAPLTTIPKDDNKHRRFYPIFKTDENYSLSFKIMGFYLVKYPYPFCKIYEEGKRMFELYNTPANALIAEFKAKQNSDK